MAGQNACGGKFTNCFLIPHRYLLGIMTSLATFTSYTLRVAISLSITEMVAKSKASLNETADLCPVIDNGTYITVKNTDVLYDWNERQQGLILSSFYWSYIITHLPGALLAEKYGGKHVLGAGMLLNAILTLLFPMIIIKTSGDWVIVIILRVCMGLGQGMLYPVVTTLLAQWIPAKEMGFTSSLSYAGALMGTVVTTSLGGTLIQLAEHWNIIFYFFGVLALVWNIAWQLVCYSFPRTHPCIKQKEKEYLEQELENVSRKKLKTPWKAIFTSIPVWNYILAQFGHDWGWFTMVTDLPKYMNAVLRFNIQENGLASALPYFFMYFATLGTGFLADWIIKKKYLSTKRLRQIFGTLGTLGPAVFMVLASYVGCQRYLAVGLFTMSLVSMGFFYSGIKVNALDLAPNFAGTIMALANGIGVFAGMAAPYVIGELTPNQTLSEWRLVFWLTFIIMAVTNVTYVIFLSVEVQPWNYEKKEEQQTAST